MLGTATLPQATMASAHVFVTFLIAFLYFGPLCTPSKQFLVYQLSTFQIILIQINRILCVDWFIVFMPFEHHIKNCLQQACSMFHQVCKKREISYRHIFDIADHLLCIRKKKLLLSPNIVPIIMPDYQSLFLHTIFWHLNNGKNDSCSWWKSPFHILHRHTLT